MTLVFSGRESYLHFFNKDGGAAFTMTYPRGMSAVYSGNAHSACRSVNPKGFSHRSTLPPCTQRIMIRLAFGKDHGACLRLPCTEQDGAEVVEGMVKLIHRLGQGGVLSSHGGVGATMGKKCDHDQWRCVI